MDFKESRRLFTRAKRVIPGGVNSPVRAYNAVEGTPPIGMVLPLWLVVLGAVLGVCSQSVVSLYPAVAFTMLYREVIRRRRGDDLAEAIRARLGD